MRVLMMMMMMGALLFVGSVASAQGEFDYLRVKGREVESVHRIKYVVRVDRSFKLVGEVHHRPTYGGKLFNVSVAAFARGDELVMIHAEAHADGSGGLDYSNLKPDPLGGIAFNSREQCAVLAEIPNAYESIPDLRMLREGGFVPEPGVFLKQYLIASPDGSAEFVYSYGRRVASCAETVVTPAFKAEVERAARAVSIKQK